jgi:hypothetical protein
MATSESPLESTDNYKQSTQKFSFPIDSVRFEFRGDSTFLYTFDSLGFWLFDEWNTAQGMTLGIGTSCAWFVLYGSGEGYYGEAMSPEEKQFEEARVDLVFSDSLAVLSLREVTTCNYPDLHTREQAAQLFEQLVIEPLRARYPER